MSDRPDSDSMRVKAALDLGRRQSLLARMAGNIASGIAGDLYFDLLNKQISPASDEARAAYDACSVHAVEIAERILKRIGL